MNNYFRARSQNTVTHHGQVRGYERCTIIKVYAPPFFHIYKKISLILLGETHDDLWFSAGDEIIVTDQIDEVFKFVFSKNDFEQMFDSPLFLELVEREDSTGVRPQSNATWHFSTKLC